jgi:hypothetical protein
MTLIFVRKIELQAGKDSQGLEMAKKLASHIKEYHLMLPAKHYLMLLQ